MKNITENKSIILSQAVAIALMALFLAGTAAAQTQTRRPVSPARSAPALDLPDLNKPRSPQARPLSVTEVALKLAEFGDQVRMGTQMDLLATLQTYGTPEFMASWQSQISPYFVNQDRQWQDFFRNAVVFGGRINGLRGVIIYYNPWSDTAMVVGADLREETITEFFVMTGERLRSEPVSARSVKPAWYADPSRITQSMGKVYAATESAIARHYPLEGPYMILASALRQRVSSQQAELAPVKARMIDRMAILDQLQKPTAGSPTAQAQRDLEALSIHLKRGDRTAFEKLVSSMQDGQMTEILFDWPAQSRMRLAPVYYRPDEKGAVAALVSPFSPMWFVSVRLIDDSKGQRQIGYATLYNLDIAKKMLNKE